MKSISLRCEGTITGQGTVFIKNETRNDGTKENVLFERKGLGTAGELIKNIFRKKSEEAHRPEDWAKTQIDMIKRTKDYSAGRSIEIGSLIKNISEVVNTSSTSSINKFSFTILNKEKKLPEKINFELFIEKAGSLPSEMVNEFRLIKMLRSDDEKIVARGDQMLKRKSDKELSRMLSAVGFLQTSGKLEGKELESKNNKKLDKIADNLRLMIHKKVIISFLEFIHIEKKGPVAGFDIYSVANINLISGLMRGDPIALNDLEKMDLTALQMLLNQIHRMQPAHEFNDPDFQKCEKELQVVKENVANKIKELI